MPVQSTRRAWKRALVVGEADGLELLTVRALDGEGFRVRACAAPPDAEALSARELPDAIILFSRWPQFTCTFIRSIRQLSDVCILVVCSTEVEPAVPILDSGADDVVPLETPASELVARVRAMVRRRRGISDLDLQPIADGLMLDLLCRRVRLGDAEVQLTAHEFRLLQALATTPGRPVTHEALSESVWGTTGYEEDALRAIVKRLRAKLAEARGLVQALYGIGYYLDTSCLAVDCEP